MNAPSPGGENRLVDILIIDDDDQVRATLTKMLEQAGFMVGGVDNGLAALAELRQRAYRAILCDVQMPFLSGRSFFDELRAERPDLAQKVVFVTGNGEDPKVRSFLAESGRPVVFVTRGRTPWLRRAAGQRGHVPSAHASVGSAGSAQRVPYPLSRTGEGEVRRERAPADPRS